MNKESQFIYSNHHTAKLFGYKNESQLLGLNAYDMRCPAVASANNFIEQDQEVINTGNVLNMLDIHTYADNITKTLLTQKKPYYNKSEIVGSICQCIQLHSNALNKIISQLIILDKKYYPTHAKFDRSYTIDKMNHPQKLTKRELDCLFYLMRGKTMREIAASVFSSPRTVEKHIENIKMKFGCRSRSEIIEFAILKGYLSYIPEEIITPSLSTVVFSQNETHGQNS